MDNKAFIIEQDNQSAFVRIRFQGGGEVPAKLQGLFTSRTAAKLAIEAHAAERYKDEPPAVIDAIEEHEKALQERRGPGRPKKEIQPI